MWRRWSCASRQCGRFFGRRRSFFRLGRLFFLRGPFRFRRFFSLRRRFFLLRFFLGSFGFWRRAWRFFRFPRSGNWLWRFARLWLWSCLLFLSRFFRQL